MHLACEHGYLKIIDLLLEHPNINLNIKNMEGQTVLDVCKLDQIRQALVQKVLCKPPPKTDLEWWQAAATRLLPRTQCASLLSTEPGSLSGHSCSGSSVTTRQEQDDKRETAPIVHEESTPKLQDENKTLQSCLSEGETIMNLRVQHDVVRRKLEAEAEQYQQTISLMTSLITADISQFIVKELLGISSYGAAFKVQFHGNKASPEPQMMVMKLQFNISGQTLLRNKYQLEVLTLSSIPHHRNITHPLSALVIPSLPQEFLDLLAVAKPDDVDWAKHSKSFAFLMPFGGVHLSGSPQSFFTSLPPSSDKVAVTLNLFHQALSAVNHLESNSIVHRDIEEANILVDPQTHRLTLIDFGMALECVRDRQGHLSSVLEPTGNLWGNAGTIPPEIMALIQNPHGGAQLFPLSRCDSFSLAITFYNALLPPSRKFIGSELNRDMSMFTTRTLVESFPLPPPFTSPADPRVVCLTRILVDMMHPRPANRMSASEAATHLTPFLT